MDALRSLGRWLLAALIAALSSTILVPEPAAGQPEQPAVSISSFSVPLEGDAVTELRVRDLAVPPLGAWLVDVHYDDALLTAVACEPSSETQACNVAYAPGVVRLAGAEPSGLRGDVVDLATIAFKCKELGDNTISIAVVNFADTGGFEMPHSVEDGAAECTPASLAGLDGSIGSGGSQTAGAQETSSGGMSKSVLYALAGIVGLLGVSAVVAWLRVRLD